MKTSQTLGIISWDCSIGNAIFSEFRILAFTQQNVHITKNDVLLDIFPGSILI